MVWPPRIGRALAAIGNQRVQEKFMTVFGVGVGVGDPHESPDYGDEFFSKLESYLGFACDTPSKEEFERHTVNFMLNYNRQDRAVGLVTPPAHLVPGPLGMRTPLSFSLIPLTHEEKALHTRYEQVCRKVAERKFAQATPEQNVNAFLRLIRYAEHHKDDSSVYNTLYGGGHFSGYATHPNKNGTTRWGHTSPAAGAYQILWSTWDEQRRRGLVKDFSPAAQDAIAREKLKTRGATPYIEKGDIESAIPKLRKEWTSLPGAAQSKMSMQEARHLFNKFVADETNRDN